MCQSPAPVSPLGGQGVGFPLPHHVAEAGLKFAAILLSARITDLSHQNQQPNTSSLTILLLGCLMDPGPFMTVFLSSCKLKLCLTLKAFKAGPASSISSTRVWAGWLLHPLGQGPAHYFPHTHIRDPPTLSSKIMPPIPPYDLTHLVPASTASRLLKHLALNYIYYMRLLHNLPGC